MKPWEMEECLPQELEMMRSYIIQLKAANDRSRAGKRGRRR